VVAAVTAPAALMAVVVVGTAVMAPAMATPALMAWWLPARAAGACAPARELAGMAPFCQPT
jgi:hypothetical protein